MELTKADIQAINMKDAAFLLNKGAECYRKEQYNEAVMYYQLAAAQGDEDISGQAASNLGYCYLYGRHQKANPQLAIAYFQIAANSDNSYALYKLGDIYEHGDKYGIESDSELAIFYYKKAEEAIGSYYRWHHPSLCYALARARMPEGILATDIEEAYKCLKDAKRGYEKSVEDNFEKHAPYLKEVNKLLEMSIFDKYRETENKNESQEEDLDEEE